MHKQPNSSRPHELNAPPGELTTYRVQVGHTTTTVAGRTAAEAIFEARRRLCQEMPRMWDKIQKLDDAEFTVVAVK